MEKETIMAIAYKTIADETERRMDNGEDMCELYIYIDAVKDVTKNLMCHLDEKALQNIGEKAEVRDYDGLDY
ncbi:MAG: hypothetical protein IKB62_04195 [Oscillospiraceae bacterium]|nr:hypothetical protein [Oscillospiraceae bacterium]